jgi:hypothetical protein
MAIPLRIALGDISRNVGHASKMSLIGDKTGESTAAALSAANRERDFPQAYLFVPEELIGKCRALIESYHGIHGYAGLPDMLWLSDVRDVIECDRELAQLFKRAAKSRGARRANESLVLIATIALALEVLARDFANWGKRYPAAKREAEKVLGGFPARQNSGLIDAYLYPSSSARREFSNMLASDPTAAPPAKN